jgi:alpha-beta hydrolase superfamily lysophospholipase
MIEENIQWTNNNINFSAHLWKPEDSVKAVIVLVHGFGEHCSRYTPYVSKFTEDNIAVLGFDLQGHGKTEGKRGVILSYDSLMSDIDMALNKAKEIFPNISQILYGHSMGGNLVSNYLIRKKPKITGAVITSPWLKLTNEPNFILKGVVSVFSKVLPNVTTDSGLDTKYISTVEEEVRKYNADTLNHSRISFLLFEAIRKSGLYAIEKSNEIDIPVLVMHGADDNITSVKASKQFYEIILIE